MLHQLIQCLSDKDGSDKSLSEALKELAAPFSSPHSSLSSFEPLQSGLVDSLLGFTTDEDRSGTPVDGSPLPLMMLNLPLVSASAQWRQDIFLEVFL